MAASNLDYTRTIISNSISRSKREKQVVMFHIGRSGSTVLGDLFNQNQNIFWDSEIFMRNRMPVPLRPFTRPIFSFPTLVIRTRRMRTTRPIYGFEAKLTHVRQVGLSLDQFVTEMKKMNFDHFILLHRQNQLRAIISHLRAMQQGFWHKNMQNRPGVNGSSALTKSNGTSSSKSVSIDVNAVNMGGNRYDKPLPLVEHMNAVEQNFAWLNELLVEQPTLDLVYEEHIEQDPTDAYGKVCEFLDIVPTEVEVQLKKTNPWPIEELITNYDEVADTLAGSPHEWMLKS